MAADPAPAVASEHPAHPRDQYACARAWAALSAAHARVSDELSSALLRACGLSINDFETLLRLDGVAPPGLRLGELGQTIRLSQSALSRMVSRLEHQGLVGRHGDPADGRGVLLSITPAGREALRRAAPIHARCIDELLTDRLSRDEHAALADLLTRIAEA